MDELKSEDSIWINQFVYLDQIDSLISSKLWKIKQRGEVDTKAEYSITGTMIY